MNAIHPYLNFNGNCEEAFRFYQSVFGGPLHLTYYRDLKDNMGLKGDDLNLIGNASLPLVGKTVLYGGDVPDTFGQPIAAGNKFQINIEAQSANEAQQLFEALSKGGAIKMPLQDTEWAERFGVLTDRFEVHWIIMYIGNKDI